MKKISYLVIAFMFLIAACSQQSASGQQTAQSSPQKTASMGEREKYATFEAEFSCKFLSGDSDEETAAAIKESASLLQKYSYTEENVNSLREKYQDDASFEQLVLKKVNEMCPEILP
ncbi:hypothetical protein HYX05_04675 [Candidatus Woesearchaeota archaeon]|nr:hypothetical protein [Candidatus Woesearchaeota archaeon]